MQSPSLHLDKARVFRTSQQSLEPEITPSPPSSTASELDVETYLVRASSTTEGNRRWCTVWKRTRRLLRWNKRVYCSLLAVLALAGLAFIVWFSLVLTLIHRLSPPSQSNGLRSITRDWHKATDSMDLLSPFPEDFSKDIVPVPCHSHNDYDRKVPLYTGLAAGCTSVEADIWLRKGSDNEDLLLVGHSAKALKSDRTLKSLYIDPLRRILENMNSNPDFAELGNDTVAGVFETTPNATLVLLLDFKSDPETLWPVVQKELQPLREKNWLTYWNSKSKTVTIRPITVVATGETRFQDVISNTNYRDVFFDAPLEDIANPIYDNSNSYYASSSVKNAVGKMWFGRFNSKQIEKIENQIRAAADKDLKSRYWGTVDWPIGWRNRVWRTLIEKGVSILNVDAVEEAARWDWGLCIVAGLVLCGYGS